MNEICFRFSQQELLKIPLAKLLVVNKDFGPISQNFLRPICKTFVSF